MKLLVIESLSDTTSIELRIVTVLWRELSERSEPGESQAEGLGFPVSYPTSCSPQAWAAASPLLFLRTLLRFEPDIRRSSLHLAPAVADWIGTLRLERIPIMGGHLGIEVQGEIVRVVDVPEGLKIISDPRLPTRL